MCLRKNKYSSLIISLLVLLAAKDGWGIQVSENPIYRHFRGVVGWCDGAG